MRGPIAIDFEGSLGALAGVLGRSWKRRPEHNVLVNFDMEQFALKDLTLDAVRAVLRGDRLSRPAWPCKPICAAAWPTPERIIDWTRRTGRQVTVRLIKGAYWDYEVINAERMGWPVPVWTEKRQTDACFEQMAERLLAATPRKPGEGGVKLGHRLAQCPLDRLRAGAVGEARPAASRPIEAQKLYGMADQLRRGARASTACGSASTCPVGEMIPGMAYLVRRLLENTSNQSWLRAGFFDEVPDEVLLASPQTTQPSRLPPGRGPG